MPPEVIYCSRDNKLEMIRQAYEPNLEEKSKNVEPPERTDLRVQHKLKIVGPSDRKV